VQKNINYLGASITLLLPESKLERITRWSFPMLLTKLATFCANEIIIPCICNEKSKWSYYIQQLYIPVVEIILHCNARQSTKSLKHPRYESLSPQYTSLNERWNES
jgi:hypothetical protein